MIFRAFSREKVGSNVARRRHTQEGPATFYAILYLWVISVEVFGATKQLPKLRARPRSMVGSSPTLQMLRPAKLGQLYNIERVTSETSAK
jgi:hypothetical protein